MKIKLSRDDVVKKKGDVEPNVPSSFSIDKTKLEGLHDILLRYVEKNTQLREDEASDASTKNRRNR